MSSKAKLTGKHQYVEFREETIVERVRKMVELRSQIDSADYHIKLSYGNRKTTALVPSISLIPIADCGNCAACRRGCYDVRNVCCYEASRKQRAVNSAIYQQEPARYFKEVEMSCHFLRFFRWHIGGDIKDYSYLANMVRVAENVPGCQFLAFTKMFDIVNDYLDCNGSFPSNLHVIFSDWRGLKMDNRHNLPVSSPIWSDGTTGPNVTNYRYICPGNCSECAETNTGCWGAKSGDTIIFEAH